MANGFMATAVSPLDFDPNLPGGYASTMPVLGQGPIASQMPAETMSPAVLGAAPMPAPAPATGLGVLPLDSLPRGGFSGIGSQYAAAPPPAAPMAPAAPAMPATAQARPTPRQGAGTGAPDSFMGVDLTGAKKALAEYQREQPATELGRIAYGLRTAEGNAAQGALTRTLEAQPEAVKTLEAAQEAERAAQEERATLVAEQAAEARLAESEAAAERDARRKAVQETTEKLDAATKALDDSKLDVEAAYGGAAGRIFAGLAVALGSFGASMTGGPNYAMQLVNQRIDRELDAQRTEIEKKKGKVNQLGQLLQRNETLLGDATQARNLARAQTFKALADDVEARSKGRAMAPQQAQVLQQLRNAQAEELDKLKVNVAQTTAARQSIGAQERQAQRQLAYAESKRLRDIAEKRAEKAFESGLKTEEALSVEAGKKAIEEGPTQPGQASPKALDKVLETAGKPTVGTKDIVGALRSLNQWDEALMAYGQPEAAPGGSTAGAVARYTPSFTEKARNLDQMRMIGQLGYQVAVTGAGGSEEQMAQIRTAAGGDDPMANKRYIEQERAKQLGRLEIALRSIPEGQRDAVRAAIMQSSGTQSGVAAASFTPARKPAGK
jgi:hypothetical protein